MAFIPVSSIISDADEKAPLMMDDALYSVNYMLVQTKA